MMKHEILYSLDCVYKDLLSAANAYRKSEELGWDDDTWTSMADSVKEGMDHIQNLECQLTDLLGEDNDKTY